MSLQLFPVYLASNGFVPPENGMYYLVAKDGIYMRVERLHGSALVKVKEIPFLDEASRDVTLNLPKIEPNIMAQAKEFFQTVFSNHRSESYLTLYYSKKLEKYRLWCPKQTVTYASVNYDRTDAVPVDERDYLGSDGAGWQMVGTIHSHCDFSAFHSGTDEADEATFDGIHLTFGHVNRDEFSIASCVSFNNNRTKVNPSDVADGITEPEAVEEEHEYDAVVRGVTVKKSYRRTEYYFRLDLNDDEAKAHEDFKQNVLPLWLDKVTHYSPPPLSQSTSTWTVGDSKKDASGQGYLGYWRYGSTSSDRHDSKGHWYDDIREWDGD